jgi:hypothetical protein
MCTENHLGDGVICGNDSDDESRKDLDEVDDRRTAFRRVENRFFFRPPDAVDVLVVVVDRFSLKSSLPSV